MLNCTKHKAFTLLSTSVQHFEAMRFSLGACIVLLSGVLSTAALASPDESLAGKRATDQANYERCIASEEGSEEACIDWFVQSACDGVYSDNRGEIDDWLAKMEIVSYLEAAEKRVMAQKKCDIMGARRLVMSLIERDWQAPDETQLKRWKFILSGMKAMIPEQQQYICGVMVEDSRFERLVKDKSVRSQLGMCLTSLEATNVSQAAKITVCARFESAAPELLTEDARALLIIDDIQSQRYKTAFARFEELDLSKVSETMRAILINRAAPLGESIFKHWTLDGLHMWRPGYETQKSEKTDRLLVLWDALLKENPSCMGWYAELEARILIPRGEFARVAARAAQLLSLKTGNLSTENYIRKLISLSKAAQQSTLLKHMAIEFAKLSGNARDTAKEKFGKLLAETILMAVEIEIQTASEKGKVDKNAISPLSEASLRALQKMTDEPALSAVLVMLGRVMAYRGDNAEALKLWHEAIQSQDSAAANEAWFLLITQLRKQGKKDEADAQYKAFEEQYPGSTWFERLQ